MFKLESYITPLLMGYLDKYVKLRQEDFQLSLWGGDAVLNNLDLRLDELEKVLQLPVMFQSGHIHELRLHVPWTKLGSEPVVITINTVECIVKVRDTAYEATSSGHSSSAALKAVQQRQKMKRRSQPSEDLPPGYLQSIVNRIINNVTFIINNLILKFVEDDIVLSVNIKSAECYSVDKEWNRAFVDLTADDLALRKVLNFADLTVCLDKTNASGHIESYQEPVAYRCAVTCRLYMEYESTTAKFPRVTRFNLYCETLNLSLTDTQLPMLVRLIELCIAMYYGLLDIPSSSSGSHTVDVAHSQHNTGKEEMPGGDSGIENMPGDDQGWMSWAWSYVPQLLPEEEEEMEGGEHQSARATKAQQQRPVLSLGFYIHQGSIVFKLTEKSRESTELPHKKMQFHPFLKLSGEGLGIEIVLQGLSFFNIQCGMTSFKITTCGNCICGVADEKAARCNTILKGGEPLDSKVGLNYISNSLFDDVSWENRGQRSQHIVNGDEHRQVYTEQHALQRYGAFWIDSVYTWENAENHGAGSHSSEADHPEAVFEKEFSTLRFVFGNTHLKFSSTAFHRISKFIVCAKNHQYQPYGSSKPSTTTTAEERPKPTEEQIESLEEFIPTHLLHLMFINPTVTILTAEHPHCDVAKKNYKSRLKKRDNKTAEDPNQPPPIPAVVMSATRFDLQITRPMYAGRLVKLVTAIAGPSSNLLHHCHSHTQIKLFSLQMGLQRANWDGKGSRPLTLVPPCSFALYSRSLQLPKLWTNSSLPLIEWMYELPNTSVNVNKASVLLCSRVLSSWLVPSDQHGAEHILDDSLLDDLFPMSGESTHHTYPLLELGLYGLEFKSCESTLVNACVGSLSLLHVFLYTPGIGGKMSVIPIVYGPNDTSSISDPSFFTKPTLDKVDVRADCITATFQKPKHTGVSEAQALALVDCQGFCVWLDPGLMSWFHYCPQPKLGHKTDPPVSLDLSLAQMTSPLNAVSQASVHSTSSPSHPGGKFQSSLSHPPPDRPMSIPEEVDGEKEKVDGEKDSIGELLAQYFPLVKMLHVQVELKPSAIFLPKTTVPNSESSSDILTIVHQARHAGRLSDTLVICVPSIVITSTMTKPMNIVQDLPVTSIQGSLIGEKLPWTVKVSNICVYSLLSGRPEPLFIVHPMDIVSTVAVTCKYNPPTSENISTMALCLHVDVGQPKIDVTAAQLLLCSTLISMFTNVTSNARKLLKDCMDLFIHKSATGKPSLSPRAPASQKKSASSTAKIESVRSADVTENVTTDISEDFSHEGSPLHENIIDDMEDAGVKLSLWLQLMLPKLDCILYTVCPVTHLENGVALTLDHLDLSMDSQNVYSKAKVTLGSVSVQHAVKSQNNTWSWTNPEGIVLSCSKQLPRNLHTVTNKVWAPEHSAPVPSFAQPQEAANRDNKHGVLSITFTRALCKNVKKRLRKANVELPIVNELDPSDIQSEGECGSCLRREDVEFYFHEYLSEVCVKTEPVDIVLKPELLDMVASMVAGLGKVERKSRIQSMEIKTTFPNFNRSPPEDSHLESASVHNLPLLYADVGLIRLFIAKSHRIPSVAKPAMTKGTENKESTVQTAAEGAVVETSLPSTVIDIEVENSAASQSQQFIESSAGFTKVPVTVDKSSLHGLTGNIETTQPGSTFQGPAVLPPKAISEVCSTLAHDMIVVQMGSCLLQPHADNPLPRTAQEKEIYLHAVQSGFSHQPGAAIEDRQYQVDVKGVTLSTGVWSQIMHEVKQKEARRSPSGSMVQIPALDWNTFLMDSPAHEMKEIKLIPLVTPFDLCLVLAPPITYVPKPDSLKLDRKAKLICGFTSELNLTSDLDVYLSTSQIKLLTEVATQFADCFMSRSGEGQTQVSQIPPSPLDVRRRSQQPLDMAAGVDSGVESDLSTLTFDRGHQRHVIQSTQPPAQAADLSKESGGMDRMKKKDGKAEAEMSKTFALMPLIDILVTAGRISCTVYTHKVLEEDFTLEMPMFRDRQISQSSASHSRTGKQDLINARDNLEHILKSGPVRRQTETTGLDEDGGEDGLDSNEEPFTMFNFMKQVSEESLKKVIGQGSVCIIPFVYLYVTQPHCIMAKHNQEEMRIEVSCYDVLIKGASDKHVSAVDDHHVIPDCADFNVHWLETRAGRPHPFTGIPPSLLTAKFVKEASLPDTIHIAFERPVRLKVSQLAVEQVVEFVSDISQMFPAGRRDRGVREESQDGDASHRIEQSSSIDVFSLVERVELSSAQIVVAMEISDSDSGLGAVFSLEGVALEVDVNRDSLEHSPSVTSHIELKDIIAKSCYERKVRQLLGPFSVSTDACLSWIALSSNEVMPQILLVIESSFIPIRFGQEHVFCLTDLTQHINKLMEKLLKSSKTATKPDVRSKEESKPAPSMSQTTVDFVQDKSHDDLRCGGFQFIEQSDGTADQPDANEIMFSTGDPEIQENSSMSWCYPHPRIITRIHLTPVPFSLSSSTLSLDSSTSGAATVPCVLQYWDELRADFVDVTEFHLSESEAVTVSLPEPKPVNVSELVLAKLWRVVLLQFSEEAEGDRIKTNAADVAVLPASLAACMCVDSAFVPSLIPSLQLSVSVPAAELHVCNHLDYNGSELPKKLSQYQMCTDRTDEQVFAVVKLGNLSASASHVSGALAKSSIKLSMQGGLDVMEYRHLQMEDVVTPASVEVSVDVTNSNKGQQDISAYIKTDKVRVSVGKSAMHTINMAVAAWTAFNPKRSGPHLIFSHYVVCNNTTSTIRFGQAGTDENIILNSREMYAYSLRSHTSPQMMHLCMDKPTWKWTEPFPIDKECSLVRSVAARDQSYVVIVRLRRLSNLQMQVTVYGQLVICNRLSQPISVKMGRSAINSSGVSVPGATDQSHQYIIQPGDHLPSQVANEVMVSPVQFRLAGYSTSWSHDIFLSGDRMKDNQMIKIPLPDGVNKFHVWCRIFCQHFYGMPQKLIMLTPLYVVRTHLPRPLYINLDSPKVKQSQEIMVGSQGREFQLHCTGGDVTYQLAFRLGADMQLSSPAVVLSTGLIGQLTRSQVTNVDIEEICEQKMDLTHGQWPYLLEEPGIQLDIDPDLTASPSQVYSTEQKCAPSRTDAKVDLDPELHDLEPQPSIDLNVRLSEYIPGCETLLVEVSPSYLVHNATDMDVMILGSGGRHWSVKSGHTIAPPLLKDEFKLSVKCQNITSTQKTVPMSEESMDYRRYNDDIGRVLFIDGYVHVSFQFLLREANKMEMVFITVTSDLQHGMRVICIRERFALTNQTGKNLSAKLLALPLSPQPIRMSETDALTISSQISGESSFADGTRKVVQGPLPLFRWSTIKSDSPVEIKEEEEHAEREATFVYYVSFSTDTDPLMSSAQNEWRWSFPVRLVSSKDGHRLTTSIPEHEAMDNTRGVGPADPSLHSSTDMCSDTFTVPVSHAVCIATQQVKGVTHIVLTSDTAPACVVENLCPFALQFGQTCDKLTSNDATIQEQVELVSDLPWVPPGGWCHYTPPCINTEFVAKDTINIPKLHFRAVGIQTSDSVSTESSKWSTGTQISGNTDAFVRLPGFCDLKVMIQMQGLVTHLVVRPVSKAEVTAKEIRSRIKDHGEVKRLVTQPGGEKSGKFGSTKVKWESQPKDAVTKKDTPELPTDTASDISTSKEASSPTSLSSSSSTSTRHSSTSSAVSSSSGQINVKKAVPQYSRFSEREKQRQKGKKHTRGSITVGLLCNSFTLALLDESETDTLSELLCLHLKDLFVACYPVSRGPDAAGFETSYALSASQMQIDNQQYGLGSYDFPVIFIPQKIPESTKSDPLSLSVTEGMSVLELHAIMRSRSFMHIQLVTFSDPLWHQFVIESIDILIKPFSLHVDDTFIYRLVQELEYFLPSRLSVIAEKPMSIQGALNRRLPAIVKLNCVTLTCPIRVKHMTIQPIKMLLSVHASLKLFLASDHTPLSVSKFERTHVYSTMHRLILAVTMHYASAAVFRAGIVVGSLEILGNPTGLVRSIGTGVSDLFSLPYSGLTRGPGAFVSGLSRGMGSLVKNVSAGMITSVTNFASSVSRNMDRLSFDSSHLERQEENRRNRPVGLSDGLRQGLTGFGISLLGAVAGLADQPIQTLLASGGQDERRSSASSAASGLVTGMGKGLVGVFTKPIGGAAEFVSQTGQGILHGTGLGQLPARLEKPISRPRLDLPNSLYKYSVKIFSSLPNPYLLLSVPALTFDLMGSEVRVELLLTPDVLVVVNLEEDAQQQALALSELECKRSSGEEGGIVLEWMDHFYGTSTLEQSQNSNKDRIAAFIDTQNVAGQPMRDEGTLDQSPSKCPSDNQSESGMVEQSQSNSRLPSTSSQSETRPALTSQSSGVPQYEFQMEDNLQELFITVFRLAKNKLQGRGFPA